MHPPIDALSLLKFLGHSPSSEPFDSWLDQHRVFGRPHCAEDDDAYDDAPREAAKNARDSEIDDIERDSVCLIYDTVEDYALLYGTPKSDGEYILRQVAFYAKDVQDYPGLQGEPPRGLKFTMNQDALNNSARMPSCIALRPGSLRDFRNSPYHFI